MLMERLDQHPLAARFNRLLPDHVFGAVEAGGRRCTGRFVVLNSFENRVYQLELDDGSMVVGKFYRPGRWSRESILDEHRFLRELEEAEIPVLDPVGPDNGRLPLDELRPPESRSGCVFQPNCPRRMRSCSESIPPLKEIAPGEKVACFLY